METRLHPRVTSLLARRVIETSRTGGLIAFPKEADLCAELGVSRSILRESMKVLVDKGMVEMKPRAGTRSKPRSGWRLLDPDILVWQAELGPDLPFLRDLCEVRLAIEPTAAGFAAVRARQDEIEKLARLLAEQQRTTGQERIELNVRFQSLVVEASRNPMLVQLAASIRAPFRMALEHASQSAASVKLSHEAHEDLLRAIERRDPLAARLAAEQVVGFAMIAAEKALRPIERKNAR